MILEYKHGLGKIEAYKRIDSLLDEMQKNYESRISNPRRKWNKNKDEMSFSLEIMGNYVFGRAYLEDHKITLEAEIPTIAMMFSSKIEDIIRQQLDKELS
jgi:hypothetical protein